MGNLLKEAICVIGIIYLIMHIAYGLTSAVDSFKYRKRQSKEAMSSALHTVNCGKTTLSPKTAGTE